MLLLFIAAKSDVLSASIVDDEVAFDNVEAAFDNDEEESDDNDEKSDDDEVESDDDEVFISARTQQASQSFV